MLKSVLNPVPLELQDVYLTERQQEIIKHLAKGLFPKEIAKVMNTTPSAIRASLFRANKQLNATQYTVVFKAHLLGLVRPQVDIERKIMTREPENNHWLSDRIK